MKNMLKNYGKAGMLLVLIMFFVKVFITTTFADVVSVSTAVGINGTVNVNPDPMIVTEPNNQTTCAGGSVSFTVVASGTNLTYQWLKGNTNLTNGGNISGATSSTLTINPANSPDAGSNYWVVVSGTNGPSVASNYVSLILANLPSPTITGTSQICPGSSGTLDAGAYSSYMWSNGGTNETININTAGTYMVTVTSNSVCTSVGHVTVHSYPSPAPQILTMGLSNLCGGGTATLHVGASYPSYIWSTGSSAQAISINTGGTYMVTVTDINGCVGSSSFTDNNVTCNIPTSPATTNIGSSYSKANWVEPACYYNFTVAISLHNNNVWTTYTLPANSHYTFSGLTRNTTYDWQVRTNCTSDLSMHSDWSPMQTFTTSAARMEEDITSNPDPIQFNIYPNPAKEQVTIAFNTENAGSYILNLIDMTGRVVKTTVDNAGLGDNTQIIDINGIPKGIYIVQMRMGDVLNNVKLAVE